MQNFEWKIIILIGSFFSCLACSFVIIRFIRSKTLNSYSEKIVCAISSTDLLWSLTTFMTYVITIFNPTYSLANQTSDDFRYNTFLCNF